MSLRITALLLLFRDFKCFRKELCCGDLRFVSYVAVYNHLKPINVTSTFASASAYTHTHLHMCVCVWIQESYHHVKLTTQLPFNLRPVFRWFLVSSSEDGVCVCPEIPRQTSRPAGPEVIRHVTLSRTYNSHRKAQTGPQTVQHSNDMLTKVMQKYVVFLYSWERVKSTVS